MKNLENLGLLVDVDGILQRHPCLPKVLFEEQKETDKAKTILKTLDGLSSVQALNLLEKCKMAVLQCEFKVD